jgi:hypothetical protein
MTDPEPQKDSVPQEKSLASLGIGASADDRTYSLDDFLPMLLTLLVPRRALTTVPTFTPKTFVDCIQVYTNGMTYSLYVFMDGEWRVFPAGDVVSQIIAGSGISVSPGTGIGAVTVTNLGVTKIIAGANIDIDPDEGTGEVTIHSDAPDAALFKSGVVVQAGNDDTDIVVSHGLGITPKLLKITATYGAGTPAYALSFGTFDGTDHAVVSVWGIATSGGAGGFATDRLVNIQQGGSGTFVCTASMDATQFTLNPVVSGSPGITGNVNILWEAYG